MRPLLVLALALLSTLPAEAQRRPWPLPPPADYNWLLEPPLLTAYVATAVPMGLAPYAGEHGGLWLIGAGYVLGPLAGWTVAGDARRGVPLAALRMATYGAVVWSAYAADYDGWEDADLILGHGLLAGVVLLIPYGVDVALLERHVRAEPSRRLTVTPALVGGTPGLGARLRW